MSADNAQINAPAAAWAWLTRQLSSPDEIPGRSVSGEWSKFKSEKDGQEIRLAFVTDWPSDFWIAKTQNAKLSHLIQVWGDSREIGSVADTRSGGSFRQYTPG